MIVLKRSLSLLEGEFRHILLPESFEVYRPLCRKLLIVVLCCIELLRCRKVGAPPTELLSLQLVLSFGVFVIGFRVELGWFILARFGSCIDVSC